MLRTLPFHLQLLPKELALFQLQKMSKECVEGLWRERLHVIILITIDISNRIEEVVEICVGDMLHHVRVIELGFNDNSVELNRGKKMVNPEEDKEKQRVDNDLESTSDPSEKMAPTVSPDGEGSERRSVEKDGSFNETCFGNDYGEKAQYQ
ncbi:hypothetical protein V6N13_055419 [Hibiscus sabdariffa]